MEVKINVNVNVTLDASPNLTALVLTALGGRAPQADAALDSGRAPLDAPKWDAPEKTATTLEAQTSTAQVEPLTQRERAEAATTATAATEAATEAATAAEAAEPGEYKERPEDVLPLLCQRFGIPENKEDRTEEQKAMAKGLNKAVREVIRDVTKNTAARAISDLRTDEDRRAFVEGALLITYNAESGEFSTVPF